MLTRFEIMFKVTENSHVGMMNPIAVCTGNFFYYRKHYPSIPKLPSNLGLSSLERWIVPESDLKRLMLRTVEKNSCNKRYTAVRCFNSFLLRFIVLIKEISYFASMEATKTRPTHSYIKWSVP